jgi:hypothetical protein
VRKSKEHGHITDVEAHRDSGSKLGVQVFSVATVRSMMTSNQFYTFGLSSIKAAKVEPFTSHHAGKTIETIKSANDAVSDNNLDNLPPF